MLTPTTSAVAARTGWSGTGSWSSGFTTVEVGSCRCRRCLRYASQIGGYAAGGYAAYSNSKHRTAVPREDFSLEPKTLRPRRRKNWECECDCVRPPERRGVGGGVRIGPSAEREPIRGGCCLRFGSTCSPRSASHQTILNSCHAFVPSQALSAVSVAPIAECCTAKAQ